MLGSTLAASITLNADTDIEFGQGVAITDACDATIVLTPITAFNNEDDIFELTDVEISDVDPVACADKVFTVKSYNNDDAGSVFSFSFIYDPETTVTRAIVGEALGAMAYSVGGDVATFTPTNAVDISPDGIDIAKFTLETSDDPTP
jgi:hypothetical protein